jgi:hypothetical protein
MYRISIMNTCDSSALSTALSGRELEPGGLTEDAFTDWELAQDRVLLYLQALSVAPQQRLMLAMQALERARARAETKRAAVPEAMIALRQILAERQILPESEVDFSARTWFEWARHCEDHLRENSYCSGAAPVSALAAPPVRRQSMRPAAMQFSSRGRVSARPTAQTAAGALITRFYTAGGVFAVLLIIFFGM